MSAPDTPPDASALKETALDRVREARGWERVLPVFIHHTTDGWRVRIYWRRLLLSLGGLALAAYLALVAAAWIYVRFHRGVSEVTFLHLALPWRWDEYRVIRGDHYIRSGREMLITAQWRAAFVNLRVGLQKNPANREGRLLLAQFYLRLRRFELAEQTLVEGLPHHGADVAYLNELFHFLLELQHDERVIQLAATILAEPGSEARKNTATLHAATARFFRGHYDRAEDLIQSRQLAHTREGRLLMSRIDWERGHRELALLALRELAAGLPKDDEVAGELAARLREMHLADEARRLNLLRQVNNPRLARPRIDLLTLYHETGDTVRTRREVDDIFREFANDADTLLSLADFAANTGDTALARRVYDHSKAHGLAWEGPAFLTVEAAIVARDYRGALELARSLAQENPEWGRRYYVAFNGLQAIAHFGLGDRDTGSLYLKNFLGQANVRSDQLVATSRRLAAVGAITEAREVLARAVDNDPLNQPALSRLIELDLASGRIDTLPASVQALLKMRKPSPVLLRAVQREVGRDRWLFVPGRTPLLDALERAS